MLVLSRLRALLLTASLLFACAAPPAKVPGDAGLVVGKEQAPLGYVEIGPVVGSHGEGCGVFGARGTAEGAMQALRNAALRRGANYLQVVKVTEPTADRNCVGHVYKAEGIAYRKPASEVAPSATPPVAAPAPRWEVLYSTAPDVSLPDSRTRLTPPEQAKILGTLFERYIESGVCGPLSDPSAPAPSLEQARASGQFRPAVGDAVAGAFTVRGARELLVLVHVGECHASAAQGYGTRRLVLMRGDRPVLDLETTATGIEAARDLNLDGTLEVVLGEGATGQGVVTKQATVVSLARGKLSEVRALGQVLEDTCSGPTPTGLKSTRVSSLAGATPEFRVEARETACAPAP